VNGLTSYRFATMQRRYSWLIPVEADAISLAMLQAVKAGDGAAFIPASEVTPAVAERLRRIAGLTAQVTEGSFECMINNRWAVVKLQVVAGGIRLSLRQWPAE
jgi:DNA-binding transcriptional LysR family regulator